MFMYLATVFRQSCAALLLGAVITGSGDAAFAAPTVVHMSPGGSDSADGSSVDAAMASLQRAVERAKVLLSSDTNEVEIWIDAGRYAGQRVAFEGLPSDKSLVIQAQPKATGRPVFDGNGKGGAWLVLLAKTGDVGNIRISGLEVVDYVTAISMSGSRDARSPRIVNVVIRNNVFKRIGQIALPDGPPSAAAVRLVNADRVNILSNRFSEIRNFKRCSSLHAIYIAHGSTENIIENNTFEDSCGDPIRFRDGSGNNKIVGNTFIKAWAKAPVSDWYCDSDARTDCTKASAECPSYGNVVVGNKIKGAGKKSPPMTMTYGGDQSSSCGVKAARKVGATQRFLVR